MDENGTPAKPGDLLVVEILNLGPLPGDEWGYTATFDRENGGGFLTDHFPCATKAIWYFEGIYAYSPHIPGNEKMNRMHFIFTLLTYYMHSRSTISGLNSPWNHWNCTIIGTAQHMEREGKRA